MLRDGSIGKKKLLYPLLAVLLAAGIYAWGLWYYGGLQRAGALLSLADVTAQNAGRMLRQHLCAAAAEIVILLGAWLRWRGSTAQVFGVGFEARRGRIATAIAAVAYVILLTAGLLWANAAPFAVLYQWGYYLVFVALAEELVFRGLLVWLMEKSGLPAWCVWIVPGVLFGCMHTLLPVIEQGFGVGALFSLLSSLGGYTVGACGFYALRQWSKTLWLPVLVHAAMDFTAVFG